MTIESIAAKGRGDEGRVQRAVDLFWDAAFERISKSPEVWVVETTYGSVNEVDLDRGICSCEDFKRHTHIRQFRCKHIISADWKSIWLRDSVLAVAPHFGSVA